jgi:hypothetical protein
MIAPMPDFHIHPDAQIGTNCRIYAHRIGPNARIGNNVTIGALSEVDCTIGDNSSIQAGALLYHGVHIGSNCFIGPRCTTTNDCLPDALRRRLVAQVSRDAYPRWRQHRRGRDNPLRRHHWGRCSHRYRIARAKGRQSALGRLRQSSPPHSPDSTDRRRHDKGSTMTQLAYKEQELTRELLTCLEKLRDTYNKEGYTIAATQLDGLLDDYHAEREQIQEQEK